MSPLRRRVVVAGAILATAGALFAVHVQWSARPRSAVGRAGAPQFIVPLDSLEARLMADVRVLADDSLRGRRMGSSGNASARAYIIRELTSAGVAPLGASYEAPFSFTGRDGRAEHGRNIIAAVRGTARPTRWVIVSAHYDHVGVGTPVNGDSIYNGADDNASGVAALLAVARDAIRHPPAASVMLVAFDGEEAGERGARAFVAAPPVPRDSIAIDINFDMVSHSDSGVLFAVGTRHVPAMRALLDSVAARGDVHLRYGHEGPMLVLGDDWVTQSDQAAFAERGLPFVYFGVEDHPDYHQPSDEVRTITPRFFTRAVELVVDAVRSITRAVADGRSFARD